ncbi:MAG TPA: glycosyl transferase family 36 [Firmicutes bacterium]|nr:glycosyl transferase family 36 [Bacillota bacterium]
MIRQSNLLLDELLEYAPQLAKEHHEVGTSKRVTIQRQLKKDLQKLDSIYYEILDRFEKQVELSTAGKWLIDNRYLLHEQYHYIQKNLRKDFFRRLPVLTSGRMKGSLRIYAILHHLLKQSDGSANPDVLLSFLWSYQQTQPLTIGELWAVPLVLRFVIFHQMRELYEEINRFRLSKAQETLWKNKVVPLLKRQTRDLNKAILSMEKHLDLSDPAVLLFLEKQFRRAAGFKPLSKWLEARSTAQNLPLPKLLEEEENAQARSGVVAGNLFTSLQEINRTNWTEYFEELSLVEQSLRQDPARVYPEMDFESRNLLRNELELLARDTRTSEVKVAETVLSLAQAGKGTGDDPLKGHVGYYLLDEGLSQLTKALGSKRFGMRQVRSVMRANPNLTYFSLLGLLFTLPFALLLQTVYSLLNLGPLQLIICGLLMVAPIGEIAIRILHALLMRIVPPRPLPKIEFRNGIPIEYSTMVVVPTLLTSSSDLRKLLKQLEVYHLANQDPHIYFALLTDFADAPTQEEASDSQLLKEALDGIAALNKRYPHPDQLEYFHLLHRERRYNPQEGAWIGWERKRGKLIEFNALLAGEEETSFTVISGNRELLKTIKYVITLDSDTQLPKEAAMRLIGAIAHPLNTPVVDEEKGIVVKGYGILQPKITVSNASANQTLFSLLHSDQTGIDIYSCAASNPYQDLFGRGIFTGKGIYDARVFHQILRKRFPENSVLSHDLLEGSFLRAGLVTDIELLDDFPSSLLGNLARKHRWTRGDWQLLPWLKKTVRNQDGEKVPLHLPPIAHWQMIDNLRQSLLMPSLLFLIWMGFSLLPGGSIHPQPQHWIVIAFLISACFAEFSRAAGVGTSFLLCLGRQLFTLITLPYQAVTMLDAIFRALYRMTVSHRHLLEWTTAAEAMKQSAAGSFRQTWRRLWQGQLVTLAGLAVIGQVNPPALPWIGPLSLLWLSAPVFVHLSALPLSPKKPKLTTGEQAYLRRLARQIWHFFEATVTAQDHWLPPDNLQIEPENGLAHRTSPTNIGLYLTSIITARDFGFITTAQMIQRIDDTIGTLEELEKWRGHLYNWYNTENLQPLHPLYISTVDSGNLVVYLLTVREGLREWLSQPWTKALPQGLLDTFYYAPEPTEEENSYSASLASCLDRRLSLWDWYSLLKTMQQRELASSQCRSMIHHQLQEMEWFFPWLKTIDPQDPAAGQDLFTIENLSQIDAYLARTEHISDESSGLPDGEDIRSLLALSKQRCTTLLEKGETLLNRIEELITAHDFKVLYDRSHRLFSIGYNVADGRLDPTFYNLLASEARQASFAAIALGQVPVKHWFALSRTSTLIRRRPVLLSWTGTIFEYLMPLLVMTTHPNTLWEKTYRAVVKSHITYGKRTKLPWGISESGYYLFDQHLNYQYKAFGVPDLAIKHSQEKEKVVAPYATILGAMVYPKEAVANLLRLEKYNTAGAYGFYEAIDFSPHRLHEGQAYAVVKSYMAHHQGMSFISLGNLFHDNQMQRRFLADPRVKGTDLLLHEQIHKPTLIKTKRIPGKLGKEPHHLFEETLEPRNFITPDTPLPKTWFLSNGRYFVMVSNSGGGFSRYGDLLLTRWEEDPVKDSFGSFFYIKNLTKEKIWSPSFQPCRDSSAHLAMGSDPGKVIFTRSDEDFFTEMEICVSPEIDAELRRISLTNRAAYPCTLEVTSVLEPVLAPKKAYQAHPTFSRLFVETRAFTEFEALVACRRTGASVPNSWLVHSVHVHGKPIGPLEYETDRSRFVGRGSSYRIPTVIETNQRLSGTTGAVLDPILSLRRCVEVEPGATVQLTFITGLASSEEKALAIAEHFSSASRIQHTFDLAQIESHLELRRLNLTTQQINVFQFIAAQLFYLNYSRKGRSEYLRKNVKDQSTLWAYGISGDLPIVLVHLKDEDGLDLAAQILQAHRYWKLKGLSVDLVLLSAQQGSYQQNLNDNLRLLVETIDPHPPQEQGKVFILSTAGMPETDLILLETVARISLQSDEGSLLSQLQLNLDARQKLPVSRQVYLPVPNLDVFVPMEPPEDLVFFNGWGGFTPNGTEYIIHLRAKDLPPAPWINVIANPQFGFTVSESGGGFTWAENSREYKLTPWSNDPVLDPSGEICYLRDEETGLLWSLNALPIRDSEPYTIRHGQGYTRFHHQSHGIDQTALVFAPTNAPVKIVSLKLRNNQDYARELAVTYYLEWTLGVHREETSPFLLTEYDRSSGALLARNVLQKAFSGYYAFLGMYTDGPEISRSWTCDRREFIGRNGSLSLPAAMTRKVLSNTTGPLSHPCAAMQVKLDLPPRGERTINIIIGSAGSLDQARNYTRQFGRKAEVRKAYQDVVEFWSNLLERVQVSTPDQGFDLLMNRWLLYQTVSCRLWARSAFYQAGGAFGFRDQLQDALALLHARPGLTRKQILLHAAHQYKEGDVQHWWHEETGYGIRTRISDDLLWLPYAVCRYVQHTGDQKIWNQEIPFLESPPLQEDEMERYEPTVVSEETGTLYEHCIRAIERSLRFGAHGLPLMGGGDWNDGMNLVGAGGSGESVWLGWFLYQVLKEFIPFVSHRNETDRADEYERIAENLAASLNEQCWDGQWFRRAYNDRGEPLGAMSNLECQIDCIAQAWAVISGAADPDKALMAMASLDAQLVCRGDKSLVCLLTPPFSQSEPSPGYIQAYPRGVRENGGQYTHGAIWAIIAWALLGKGNKAYELFQILNPINHSRTPGETQQYKVEPYVMAADVYSVPPYEGRGGWSWYTGAAGWMYQAGLEWILGIRKKGEKLYLKPCIPADWSGYSVVYRYGRSTYHLQIENPAHKETGGIRLVIDGKVADQVDEGIPLVNDGQTHQVLLVL